MVTEHQDTTEASVNDLARALQADLGLTERRIQVAGVSTSVLEAGEGAPVVLLHGQGAFAESWGRVIPALAERHQVIAPDLPGLGRSTLAAGRLDGASVVAWLDELIGETCKEPPTLVGISLGGTVAAHYGVGHGARARSIVLIDSGSLGPFRPAPGAFIALMRYVRRPSAVAFGRFARYALAHPAAAIAPQPQGGPPPFVAYHVNRAKDAKVRAANRQLVRWSIRPIPTNDLRSIRVPVSLIWGKDDRIMRFRIAEKVSKELGWPLTPIEDCGHVPFVDQPSAFMDALEQAVDGR